MSIYICCISLDLSGHFTPSPSLTAPSAQPVMNSGVHRGRKPQRLMTLTSKRLHSGGARRARQRLEPIKSPEGLMALGFFLRQVQTSESSRGRDYIGLMIGVTRSLWWTTLALSAVHRASGMPRSACMESRARTRSSFVSFFLFFFTLSPC